MSRHNLMFAFLCLVWGSTWIAMKIGTVHVPPGVFSGTRWITAGAVILVALRLRGERLWVPPRLFGRLMVVAFLLIASNQLLMMYSLRVVGSGLAAVINCALTPLSLLGFAIALGQERLRRRTIIAMALGVCGILLLFGPAAMDGRLDGRVLLGVAGITIGTLTYAAGSVMARPLMGGISAFLLAGIVNLLGGLMLLAGSLAFEPGSAEALSVTWDTPAIWAWLLLVGPASLGASTIFFVLVRDWGATKAGSFAFISPIVAVLLGLFISGEALHPIDAAGMVMMLVAAGVALRRA